MQLDQIQSWCSRGGVVGGGSGRVGLRWRRKLVWGRAEKPRLSREVGEKKNCQQHLSFHDLGLEFSRENWQGDPEQGLAKSWLSTCSLVPSDTEKG